MKLSDFLAALRTNNITVTINDLQDKLVCKIDAASYSALSDDLENRIVNRWNINGATSISVVLNDAVAETEPETDPTTEPTEP